MASSAAFALAIFALLSVVGSGTDLVALPILMLWTFSPLVARWVSYSPPQSSDMPVSERDARDLRFIARRDWRFFETYVTAADQMLPPDNFQEEPRAVARRTSPTNIGLYLLSIISARDFGWIGTLDALARLEATMKTMKAMERFRGHFYNWYATEDLRPLYPRYVSTVDSGNLAGHLLVLKQACHEMALFPAAPSRRLAGIRDTIDIAAESLAELSSELSRPPAGVKRLMAALDDIRAMLEVLDGDPSEFAIAADGAAALDRRRCRHRPRPGGRGEGAQGSRTAGLDGRPGRLPRQSRARF